MIKQTVEIIFNPELVVAKGLAGHGSNGDPMFGVAMNNAMSSAEHVGDIKIIFPTNKAFEIFISKAIEGRMTAFPNPAKETGEGVDDEHQAKTLPLERKSKKKNA